MSERKVDNVHLAVKILERLIEAFDNREIELTGCIVEEGLFHFRPRIVTDQIRAAILLIDEPSGYEAAYSPHEKTP